MFPVAYNPRLNFCILVPGYDPLLEYYSSGNVARASKVAAFTPSAKCGGSSRRNSSEALPPNRPVHGVFTGPLSRGPE